MYLFSDCNAAFSDDGFLFILNHFDALFSAVYHARDLDTRHLITSHNIVLKGHLTISIFVTDLQCVYMVFTCCFKPLVPSLDLKF